MISQLVTLSPQGKITIPNDIKNLFIFFNYDEAISVCKLSVL